MDQLPDQAEMADIEARNCIGDEQLLSRVKHAPDYGGQWLVELSEFMERQAAKHAAE